MGEKGRKVILNWCGDSARLNLLPTEWRGEEEKRVEEEGEEEGEKKEIKVEVGHQVKYNTLFLKPPFAGGIPVLPPPLVLFPEKLKI